MTRRRKLLLSLTAVTGAWALVGTSAVGTAHLLGWIPVPEPAAPAPVTAESHPTTYYGPTLWATGCDATREGAVLFAYNEDDFPLCAVIERVDPAELEADHASN